MAPATLAPWPCAPWTRYATHHTSPKGGRPRTIAVTLPFVTCFSDDKHYTAPPKAPPAERAPPMTARVIRRALGRDPEPPMPSGVAAILEQINRQDY